MRVRETFDKKGVFWIPTEDKTVNGLLKIKDGGAISLELLGVFECVFSSSGSLPHLGRVVGLLDDGKYVTLEDCIHKSYSVPMTGSGSSVIHPRTAIIGRKNIANEEIKFSSIRFTTDGLNQWVGSTGVEVDYHDRYKGCTINYQPKEPLKYQLDEGFGLAIYFSYSLSGFGNPFEAKISETAYFEVVANKTLKQYLNHVHCLNTLICLATGKQCSISNVSGVLEFNNGENECVEIFYKSYPFSEQSPKIYDHEILFDFKNIEMTHEEFFKKWFSLCKKIEQPLGLYISAEFGVHRYLNGQFLAVAQALESYHRRTADRLLMDKHEYDKLTSNLLELCPDNHKNWLSGKFRFGNEISFRARLKELASPYDEVLQQVGVKRIISRIVDARNYLTHYDESLKSSLENPKEIYVSLIFMKIVFRLNILSEIGFSNDQINVIASNNELIKRDIVCCIHG